MIGLGIFAVVVFALTILIMNSDTVQTFLGRVVANNMAKRLDTEVEIERISIDFFNKAYLEGFTLYDQEGDTLIHARSVDLGVLYLGPRSARYRFSSLRLQNADFRLKQIAPNRTNLDFITEDFASEDTTKSESRLNLKAGEISLSNCHFSYVDPFDTSAQAKLDFTDLDIKNINGEMRDFQFQADSMITQMESFTFDEKSGFRVNEIAGQIKLGPKGIFTENLSVQTANSSISGDVALLHDNWKGYGEFTSTIEWDATFEESVVNIGDIGYFADDLKFASASVVIEGEIQGPIANLKGRKMEINAGSRTTLEGKFDIVGLPDAENAFLDLRIKSLETDYNDIVDIGNRVFGNQATEERIPIELKNAGTVRFSGDFTGFPQDFVAFGSLNTEAGILDIDLNLKADTSGDGITYKGNAAALAFDIGRILDVENLGEVTADVKVTAYSNGELESANLDGKISSLIFKGYRYENIFLNGDVASNLFSGKLESDDPNLNFIFDGAVDFSGTTPLMDFYAEIYNFDLSALNLVQSKEPLSFSTIVRLNAEGDSPNTFNGSITAKDSYLCRGDSVVFLEQLSLNALGDRSNRKISFTSSAADITVTGAFDTDALPASFKGLLGEVVPSLVDAPPTLAKEKFTFSMNYKASNTITGLLVPGLVISPNTTIYGEYDSDARNFGLFIRSPDIAYRDYDVKGVTIDFGKISEVVKSKIFFDSFQYKDIVLENFDADLEAYNDLIELGLGWFNRDKSTEADLEFSLALQDRNTMQLKIKPGYIGRDNATWTIRDTSHLQIDSTSFCLDTLLIQHNRQKLLAYGCASEDPDDKAYLEVEAFDLASVDTLLRGVLESVSGRVNLRASIADFYKKQIVLAEGLISNLAYEEYELGNITLSSTYSGKSENLDLEARLNFQDQELMTFKGGYNISSEDPLTGKLKLNGVDLEVLNAFDIPEVNQYSGSASGEIEVGGDFNRPAMDGYIDFDQATFRVEYLNTYFTFSDRVRVEEDWFGIDYKPIYDSRGNKGFIVASAFHNNFSNWSYDISADVNDFFLMNTTRKLNNVYYGTAYGSGTLQLGGYDGFLEINIDATTSKGTVIKLPLDETEDVTLENFVYFVSDKEDNKEDEREADLSGVQLRLNVDATPDAEVQLIFDEKAGDIIRGSGQGRLTFEISESGEFLMFGRYEIAQGDYLFTLQNLINKRFEIRRGGVIGWYGDPYQADIDLTASYSLRTPLYPIMIENRDNYRGREDVNVILHLKDKLLNPVISFDIELPQSTETERMQLQSVVNTTQQLNQQVFALLILNKFLPVTAAENTQSTSAVGGLGSATTSDFVSNQISSWLSQISQDFDIGVNYRPGDQISNQEIAVALSTQLFNERLYVRGNFGVTSASEAQYTQGQSGFLGDFLVEYMLTEEGKIRLKVFNETNPYEVFSTSSSIYTQGVGLVYQEDFDTLDEFFQEVGKLFSKDEARQAENP